MLSVLFLKISVLALLPIYVLKMSSYSNHLDLPLWFSSILLSSTRINPCLYDEKHLSIHHMLIHQLTSCLHVPHPSSPTFIPLLTFITKCGAFDMLSKPPVATTSECPSAIDCDPNITDFKPEEQTLLIVVHVTPWSSPAFMAACRAGACPIPADRTLPRMTS